MVRKIIIVLAACFLCVGKVHAAELDTPAVSTGDAVLMYNEAIQVYSDAVQTYATALEVYQGTISTTYLTFFKDIVNSLGINEDYLLYRDGDNSYSMIVGDIENNGSYFEMSTGRLHNITSVSGSGYTSSYYKYTVTDVSDISIDVGNYLVYSNLGHYPTLENRGVNYEFTTLVLVCIMFCISIIRPLFNYILRPRGYRG